MPTRITRRAVARLLASGSAALALPGLLHSETAPVKPPTRPRLTTAERRQMEKSMSQLASTAEKVRKVPVPIGTEPAFVFRPRLPRR